MNNSSCMMVNNFKALALKFTLTMLLLPTILSCGEKKCVDTSKPALEECRANTDNLRDEINTLKRQLAQAIANPGTIKIDPSVLVINGEHLLPKLKEGNLSQEEVIKTMKMNKPVLKVCYERAMKKNASLRRQSITLTVAFKVTPSGSPKDVLVSPNYDSQMIDCMQKSIRRWRFPTFSGQAIGVESPLTLTPKHN